ncbi:MAG: hypothetical protein J0H42_25995 [Rhizobiales bacterium]|nr:hypothetical protein [Hyphomicrobiales bacterium]
MDRRHALETTYSAEFATFSEQIQDLWRAGDHAATVLKDVEDNPMRDFWTMEADRDGAI